MNEWLKTSVSPDASRRVHSGVMKRIHRRRNARRGAGTLALLALLAFLFWPSPQPLETLALTAPAPPAAPEWIPPPLPAKKSPVLMAKAPSGPAERITIYTDDPDVVIVLVADGGEE
jgi:hypothetical protein